jgi:aryl-alcohol dehydrogenase-like predicted oxidoreductase/GNAT superfamily N-acetyltransferase
MARRYIRSAEEGYDLVSVRDYVAARSNREDVLFLGIFDVETQSHIGNVKFEPVDAVAKTATVGILIGDKSWRGRGIATEALEACARWLFENRGINQIILRVANTNVGAIRAYEKAGFNRIPEVDRGNGFWMVRIQDNCRRLAVGTVQFGISYGIANQSGQVTLAEGAAILQRARRAGVDTLDTASAYGDSEARLGLIGVGTWRVVSKIPPVADLCSAREVSEWVTRVAEESLQRLGVPWFYGLLLHRPSDLLGVYGEAIISTLQALKTRGFVQKVGLSIYDPEELPALLSRLDVDLIQAPYSVVDRRLHTSGWLRRLKDLGVEVHACSAFLQGLLLMPSAKRPTKFDRWRPLWERWDQWLKQSQLSPLQACLGAALANPLIDRVVVGVDNSIQLDEILSAAQRGVIEPPHELMCDDVDFVNPARWGALPSV